MALNENRLDKPWRAKITFWLLSAHLFVFEELLGDFQDEFDYDEIKIIDNKDKSYTLNAKLECDIFNNKFGNLIPMQT